MNPIVSPLPEPLQCFDGVVHGMKDALGRIQGMLAKYKARLDAGNLLPNLLESLRIELTYNSNAIEGSTLTLRETQFVIEGRSPGAERSMRELYEARNHYAALRMIEEWAATRAASDEITERDLLDVHARVLADIDAGTAGRFRSGRVLIAGTGYVPPGNQKFDQLIPVLLQLANRTGIDPVIGAAELHYNLVAVHPFNDGNGRTARLLMNYYLLRQGYPHAIIEVARRGEYLAGLDEANGGKVERFARFVVESVVGTMGKILGE